MYSELSQKEIVCPAHFLIKRKFSKLAVVNLDYCVICKERGSLICCEACVNALCTKCVKNVPKEEFFCHECISHTYINYGEVVWAKSGKYRFWPGQVMHSSQVSESVRRKCREPRVEYAVRYFGTYDFDYVHSGRVYNYTDAHLECKSPQMTSMKAKFEIALVEAAREYEKHKELRVTESGRGEHPNSYKRIVASRIVPPAQVENLETENLCMCDPKAENRCGYDSNCLNRACLIECSSKTCEGGCQNQKFKKHEYVPSKVKKTAERGFGLFAQRDVKSEEFIIEYVGEVITHEEYHRRSEYMVRRNCRNYYFLYLDSRHMIDAAPAGNKSRFINHSCEPNCEMRKWRVNGNTRIGIFALCDISADEELTFDYQLVMESYQAQLLCQCGAENCKGVLGRKNGSFSISNELIGVVTQSGSPTVAKKNKLGRPQKIQQLETVVNSEKVFDGKDGRIKDTKGNAAKNGKKSVAKTLIINKTLKGQKKNLIINSRARFMLPEKSIVPKSVGDMRGEVEKKSIFENASLLSNDLLSAQSVSNDSLQCSMKRKRPLEEYTILSNKKKLNSISAAS